MSQITHENAFPSVMRATLQSVRWRHAGRLVARAIAVGASVLLLAMTVAMMIDWSVTLFDPRVRILLTSTTLFLSAFMLLRTGVRPVIAAFGWTQAAGNVDQRIPLLEERWQTVASFAQSGQQPANITARAMLQQVTSEAVAMSTLVKPKQVVRSVSLRRSGISFAGACLVLTGFMLINLPQTSVLMQRFWSPTLNISATHLECVTGDVIVPRGQSIEIVTRMSGLHRASALMSMSPEAAAGASEEVELKPVVDKPGMLSVAVDVDASFRYRVQAGDGRTEWHFVTAIDFPVLSDIRLTVTPPDYVDEPVTEKTLIPGRIRAIQGSQFELAMKPEQELKSMTLPDVDKSDVRREESVEPDESAAALEEPEETHTTQETLTRGDDGWYHFETQLVENFTLSPMLVSPHGLTNENPRVCRIEVIEDKAPMARIISPHAETSVSPDEKIEIKFEAHDDHGIATAELIIYETETKEGEEPKILAVKQIPLGDQQLQKHVMGKTELDLKELGLEEGKSISYAVRVTDNRMLEMDPESERNRLIASNKQKSDSETGNKDAAESGSKSETGKTNENPEAPGEESLAQADADSKAGEPKTPAETSGNDPKEVDPNAVDQESSNTNTLIADAVTNGDSRSEISNSKSQISNNSDASNKHNGDPHSDAVPESEISNSKSQIETNAIANASKNGDPEAAAPGSGKGSLKDEETKGDDAEPENPEKMETAVSDAKEGDDAPESEIANSKSQISNNADASNRSNGEPQNDADPESQISNSKSQISNKADASNRSNGEPQNDADPESQISNSKSQISNKADASSNNGDPQNDGDPESENSNSKSQIANNAGDGKNSNGNPPNSLKPEDQKRYNIVAKNSSHEPPAKVQMKGQRSDAGQQQETDRQKLKISKRLDALAERNKDQLQLENPVRAKVVQIDRMLEVIEAQLSALYKHEVDESLRGDGFKELDVKLGDVEGFVTDLITETQNTAFEFVGLQMIDISSSHVTPARDAVFVAIRKPDSGADVHAEEALHHVVSARELLLALLRKYDNVVQEKELAKKIDDAIKMYTVLWRARSSCWRKLSKPLTR